MKKISTVAAKQIRNISEPKLTIGLDLGDRSSWSKGLKRRPLLQTSSPLNRSVEEIWPGLDISQPSSRNKVHRRSLVRCYCARHIRLTR